MARRIIVVVSQSDRITPARRDIEEELVAQLLLEDRIEVTVIEHLEILEEGSTGLLCLEGIKGDMIVASWLPAPVAWQVLRERGVIGQEGNIPRRDNSATTTPIPRQPALGPGVYDAMRRTIYCLTLDESAGVDAVRRQIQQLQQDAAVSVVGIQGIELAANPDQSDATTSPANPSAAANEAVASAEPSPETDDAQRPSNSWDGPGDDPQEDPLEDEMGDLVDRLDELDW